MAMRVNSTFDGGVKDDSRDAQNYSARGHLHPIDETLQIPTGIYHDVERFLDDYDSIEDPY